MKTIDTKCYLDTLCEIAKTNKTVSTVVSGGSMTPFLANGRDFVFLEVPKKPLKTGDIVLFSRENGDYVLHRIKKINQNGYFLIGDRQISVEGPVSEKQIHCVVSSVKRKGKIITKKHIVWKFYSIIWLRIVFLRPAVFKLLGLFKRKKTSSAS